MADTTHVAVYGVNLEVSKTQGVSVESNDERINGARILGKTTAITDIYALLTPQELTVAGYVCDGLSNKAISAKMGISEHTVASYLRRIYGKLRVGKRTAMMKLLLGRTDTSSKSAVPEVPCNAGSDEAWRETPSG